MRSTATIEDVARVAGVHPSTASRVLRGVTSQSVSESTRARIEDAARLLEYRPNAMARGLRLRTSNTIALVSPYIESLGFSEITRGIQAGTTSRGMSLLTAFADDQNRESLRHDLVAGGRVDGILAAFGLQKDPTVKELARSGVPLVTVNRRVEGVDASVVVQDELASRIAVEHLAGLGHRRIGHVSGQLGTDTAARRESGFRAACQERGLIVSRGTVVSGGYSDTGGYAAAGAIMAVPAHLRPSAIIAADPLSALGTIKHLREAGYRLPEDVSVISLNDHSVLGYIQPALTAVRLPFFEMGRAASEMLIGMIHGADAQRLVIDSPRPELVVRASTARAGVS